MAVCALMVEEKQIFERMAKTMSEDAERYLDNMDSVLGDQLMNPNSMYSGRKGHERFARECGVALNNFDERDRREICQSSYGKLYVKHCALRPILDTREWTDIMMSQIMKK